MNANKCDASQVVQNLPILQAMVFNPKCMTCYFRTQALCLNHVAHVNLGKVAFSLPTTR